MAVIDIADVTVRVAATPSGANIWTFITAATVDDLDTLDISTVVKTIYSVSVLGSTDGLLTAAVSSAGVVTIPGATDNEARTLFVLGSSQ